MLATNIHIYNGFTHIFGFLMFVAYISFYFSGPRQPGDFLLATLKLEYIFSTKNISQTKTVVFISIFITEINILHTIRIFFYKYLSFNT